MFSGFAMVVTLATIFRHSLGLQGIITTRHFEEMAKILLLGSIVMGFSYATEWFMAWYGGGTTERFLVLFELSGTHWPYYSAMLLFNVLVPQLVWFPRARRSIPTLLAVSLLINVGMWLERLLIIIETLSRGYLPSRWQSYAPTFWDVSLLLGTLGFFAFLFFCLVRLVPMVSMHEVRQLAAEEVSR